MRTETSVRTMRRNGQVWVSADDLVVFANDQRRSSFEAIDDRGHQIFSWLSTVFEKIAYGEDRIIARTPTPEELQQDLIVLHSELQEDHG